MASSGQVTKHLPNGPVRGGPFQPLPHRTPTDRPGGCYTDRFFGAREPAVWCAKPNHEHVRSQAERGCAFWEREAGADFELSEPQNVVTVAPPNQLFSWHPASAASVEVPAARAVIPCSVTCSSNTWKVPAAPFVQE